MALFAVALLDELASGVQPAAAPSVAADFAIDPGRSAGAVLAAFYALALVTEPWLLRWSESVPVRRSLALALVAVAAVSAGMALAPAYWLLLVAVTLYGPASGVATAVAEGALVERAPHERERTMARIDLAAGLGDLAVPALLWALDRLGHGWRGAQLAATILALALAAMVLSSRALRARPGSDPDDADAADDEPRPRVRDALANRALLGWSLAQAATGLLDEVIVAFAAVHVHANVSDDAGDVALAMLAWIAGALAGLAALDRALAALAPMRVLGITASLSLVPFAVLIATRDHATACAALAALGALAATFHPLVKARAYAAMPGHPGLVNAVAALLAPIELAAPLAIAAIAELAGSAVAIATLALVPALMLGIALTRGGRTGTSA